MDTFRLEQNGNHVADDIFNCDLLNENCLILIEISLAFVHKGSIDSTSSLV